MVMLLLLVKDLLVFSLLVCRIWASAWMGQLGGLVSGLGYLTPSSVLGAVVVRWRLGIPSSLDIEEVLAGAADSHVHLSVADVIKSFDTVDRSILDRVMLILNTMLM